MKDLAQRAHGIGRKEVDGAGERCDAAESESEERFSCKHGGQRSPQGLNGR